MRRVAAALTALALFLLPFEAWLPLTSLSGKKVSNLEVALGLAILAWAVVVVGDALRPARAGIPGEGCLHSRLWPSLAVLAAAYLSALRPAAPGLSALKVAGRLTLGALFGGAVAVTVREQGGRLLVPAALVAGATLAALLGLLDLAGAPGIAAFLDWFKEGRATLGPTLRLSATFGSANTAAMLFAPALCLALGLGLMTRRPGPRLAAAMAATVLALALTLTYSRGGIAAASVGVAVILIVGGRRVWPSLAQTLAAASLLVVLVLLANPTLRARVAVWDPRPLDAATFAAPHSLTLVAGEMVSVPARVTNSGRLTWRAAGRDAWIVGAHWLDADGQTLLFWGRDVAPLPADVPPGATVAVNLSLVAPAAGRYVLAWDARQPSGDWMAARQVATARTVVTVEGVGGEPLSREWAAPMPTPEPERRELWTAAVALWRAHPWLGVGMGGFRHLYGAPLGLSEWDDRILANSLYFEILADGGVVGVLAWGWLLVAAVVAAWQGARRGDPLALAVLGALAAWLVHGLVDVGIETTAVYALFWAMVGMAGSASREIGD